MNESLLFQYGSFDKLKKTFLLEIRIQIHTEYKSLLRVTVKVQKLCLQISTWSKILGMQIKRGNNREI